MLRVDPKGETLRDLNSDGVKEHFFHTTRGHYNNEFRLTIIHHEFVQDHPNAYLFDAIWLLQFDNR